MMFITSPALGSRHVRYDTITHTWGCVVATQFYLWKQLFEFMANVCQQNTETELIIQVRVYF